MILVDILVSIILFFSFFGGLKEGVVKNFFSLIVFIIAIPLTGLSYHLIAVIFSFLPGTNWENFIGFQLSKKTMGILGLGRLGAITARIAQGFGMRVIAHDIRDVQVAGVEMVDLDTLLEQSDVFSIHIHLNEETAGFMDGEKFSKMKPGAILLNTSRGRIVNEPDLLAALESGQLGGAGLDVVDGERLTPDELHDHPVIAYAREHDTVIVVPHIGGSTMESLTGARIFLAEKMVNFMRAL